VSRQPAWTAACLALTLAAPAASSDLQVDARLEPEVLLPGQTALFTIKVTGGGFGRLQAEPDYRLENLAVAGGPYRAENFQMLNGAVSRSLTLAWRLRPLAPGPAAVRGLRLRVRDQVYELGDREVEVAEESPDGRSSGGGAAAGGPPAFEDVAPLPGRGPRFRSADPKVFLRAEATPAAPWTGEQLLYTLYLYTQGDVSSVQPEALPSFRGFWVHEVPQAQQLRPDMVVVDGERYARVVLLQRALFALQPGRLEIEAAEARLALKVPEVGLLGSFFSRVEPRDVTSNALVVEARALPPSPPGFRGAVGQLALAASLEPREVPVGEAATLSVTLSGHGNLQGLPDPTFAAPAGVRVFPPQEEGSQEVSGHAVRARRSWSYVLIPERRGRLSLPPIEVPYFDPELAGYRLAASDGLELVAVAGATAGAAEGGVSPGSWSEPHPVRSAALPTPAAFAWARLTPWALALPWVLGAVLLWARRRDGSAAGSGRARRRLAERLRQAVGEERPRAAAALVEEAWRDYLDERWRLPPGVASTQWAQELAARGADRDAAAQLVRLADDLHYLRYAPQLSSTETLQRDLVERSRRLLRALR
jgi:hypothetical protein